MTGNPPSRMGAGRPAGMTSSAEVPRTLSKPPRVCGGLGVDGLQPAMRELGGVLRNVRHADCRLSQRSRECCLPRDQLAWRSAAGQRHERRRVLQEMAESQCAPRLAHGHHVRDHGLSRLRARFDLFLSHQCEFAPVARVWSGAGQRHAAGSVTDDLRRGQHHLQSLRGEVTPEHERGKVRVAGVIAFHLHPWLGVVGSRQGCRKTTKRLCAMNHMRADIAVPHCMVPRRSRLCQSTPASTASARCVRHRTYRRKAVRGYFQYGVPAVFRQTL